MTYDDDEYKLWKFSVVRPIIVGVFVSDGMPVAGVALQRLLSQ